MGEEKRYCKALLVETKAANDGQKVFRFRATTDTLDRQGEVVTTDGWEVENFKRNPVFLLAHDYRSLPIGKVVTIEADNDGLLADVVFDEQDETARLVQSKYERGFLNAVSVGFNPLEIDFGKNKEPIRHVRKELLEISAVAVPANPDALILRALEAKGLKLADLLDALIEQGKESISGAETTVTTTNDGYPSQTTVLWGTSTGELHVVGADWGTSTGELHVVGAEKTVRPFADLPLADRERAWDRAAAEGRVRSWAGAEDAPNARYARAFVWVDSENAENFGAYKLMLADVIDGELRAIPRAIFAAAAVMQGARGGVDIPESDRPAVRNHLARYYAKMREAFDDDSIAPPWEQERGERSAAPVLTESLDALWQHVAAAMVTLVCATDDLSESQRRRLYVGLERVYRVLDKEPPEYKPLAELAKLGPEERKGLFWEGELEQCEAALKVGAVLARRNRDRLRQAQTLIGDVLADAEREDEPNEAPKTLDANLSGLEAFIGRKDNPHGQTDGRQQAAEETATVDVDLSALLSFARKE